MEQENINTEDLLKILKDQKLVLEKFIGKLNQSESDSTEAEVEDDEIEIIPDN